MMQKKYHRERINRMNKLGIFMNFWEKDWDADSLGLVRWLRKRELMISVLIWQKAGTNIIYV